MISYISPVPIGNAVRLVLSPPSGSRLTRVLRNTTGKFAGATDPAASLVFEGSDSGFIDSCGLANGTPYFYGAFDYAGGQWVASPVATCTPAATAAFVSDDVLTIVSDRLQAGLQAAVAAKQLHPASGSVAVLTAPPVFEDAQFPVVTVHLRNDSPSEWGIGDFIGQDPFDPTTGLFTDSSGWLSGVSLEIIGWVVGNPDVRIALRKVIRSILIGNLGVFDQAGLSQIQVSQSDIEDFESYNAPVYQAVTNFSCLAPAVVIAPSDPPLADALVSTSYD